MPFPRFHLASSDSKPEQRSETSSESSSSADSSVAEGALPVADLSPFVDLVAPSAGLPGSLIELVGANLGPIDDQCPIVTVDSRPARITASRSSRIAFRIPAGAAAGMVEVRAPAANPATTRPAAVKIAVELTDGLHNVSNPVVSRSGMIFATISGPRGKQTPVSIVRVSPDGHGMPFVTGILNPTGLAFDPDGELYVTSRAEGTVYRIDAGGEATVYAEGMGIATGAAFDPEGNLYVGDRSGTIFKIAPGSGDAARQIFVYATLEPSPSAYHLAMGPERVLYVTGPTLSSNDAIWAIDRDGSSRVWYRGLGRPQGLALDADANLYVAASLHGRRGLVRITPQGEATLAVAGNNLVGVAFSPLDTTVLATHQAIFDVDLGVSGLRLF